MYASSTSYYVLQGDVAVAAAVAVEGGESKGCASDIHDRSSQLFSWQSHALAEREETRFPAHSAQPIFPMAAKMAQIVCPYIVQTRMKKMRGIGGGIFRLLPEQSYSDLASCGNRCGTRVDFLRVRSGPEMAEENLAARLLSPSSVTCKIKPLPSFLSHSLMSECRLLL